MLFHFFGRPELVSVVVLTDCSRKLLTEFKLMRGELSSSIILLSSSSNSVSNMVASDIGRGASAFMLKNASLDCPLWNISTRGSIGVVGERGYTTISIGDKNDFLCNPR